MSIPHEAQARDGLDRLRLATAGSQFDGVARRAAAEQLHPFLG